MKIISFEDIRRLNISARTCFDWTSRMIEEKGSVLLPPKISMKPAEGVFCNVMPAILANKRGGVKIVTRYPERIPSLDSKLLLFDAEKGDFLALMDANWITAMRTGAVAAHSVMLLAKKDYSRIAMIGLGNTARAAMLMLAEMNPERDFYVKLYAHKKQEVLFAERFHAYKNLHFDFTDDVQTLVKGADVIISAVTYMKGDLCPDACFAEGVLVVPIHTLGFTNCDLFFDKVYADDYGHVCHFKHFDRFKKFAEVCDVVNKKAAGRENDRERILVYNIGLSMHDINFASHIYDMLADDSNIKNIDMKDPEEKFWV